MMTRYLMGFCASFVMLCFDGAAAQQQSGLGNRSIPAPEREYVERPVAQIYNTAFEALEAGSYIIAATEFDEVERQHPYSQWARRAMVMAAYTYYLQNRYDDAILTARRFLSLYPGNTQAPYVYYLIAQCLYEQISDVSRDQRVTELAHTALLEVIRRYPNTDYARDARAKLLLTHDHIAGKEMDVGRYYLSRHAYGAAAQRFLNVATNYQTASHTPEALHRLTEVYVSLGMFTDAQTAAAILGYNFPASAWYRDSYALLEAQKLMPKHHPTSRVNRVLQTGGQ